MSDLSDVNAILPVALYKKLQKQLEPIVEKIDSLEYATRTIEATPGPQGERGANGERGPQGLRGEIGPQGFRGETGPRGETGLQGVQGEVGPQGLTGEKGDRGEQGLQGEKGDRGEQGLQGIQGEIGPQGERGENGDRGEVGPQGETGPQGERGEQGIQGERGERGEVGPQGEVGPEGPPGKDATVPDINSIVEPFISNAQTNIDSYIDKSEKTFKNWQSMVNSQLSTIGGGGEVWLGRLNDVDRTTAKVDGAYLKYDASTKKWVGASGGSGSQGPKGDKGDPGEPGLPGADGAPGADGEDALWNYTGQYNSGVSYAVGDVAVYNGELFYRKDAHGGNTGDIPQNGSLFWDLIASKGEQGVQGIQGERGIQGEQGVQGFQGSKGDQGLSGDKYQTTSSTNLLIPTIGTTITLVVATNLSYSTNQTVLVSHDLNNHIHAEIDSYNPTTGEMTAVVSDTEGSGTFSSWIVNLSGAVGAVGPQGVPGEQGPQGVSGLQGTPGEAGPSNVLSIGTVVSGSFPAVNISGTSPSQTLDFVLPKGDDGAPGPIGPSIESLIVTETTTARTLALSDTNQYIRCINASQTTVTVPPESLVAWTAGAVVYFRRAATAGAINLAAGAGVTINGSSVAPTILADQNFALKKIGTNVWDLI